MIWTHISEMVSVIKWKTYQTLHSQKEGPVDITIGNGVVVFPIWAEDLVPNKDNIIIVKPPPRIFGSYCI